MTGGWPKTSDGIEVRKMHIAATPYGAALVPDVGAGPMTQAAFLMPSPSPAASRGAPGSTDPVVREMRRDRRKATMARRKRQGRR